MATYYHLTSDANEQSISESGIKAGGDGKIFLFTDMKVANKIARNQLFLKRYTVFKVSARGFNCILQQDKVAESVASYHRVATQPLIEAKHLTLVGTFDTKLLAWPPCDEFDRADLASNGVIDEASWKAYNEFRQAWLAKNKK